MRLGVVAMTVLLTACGEPAVEHGARLFSDPGFSRATSNVFSCATCHEAVPSDPWKILPGYPLAGAPQRPSYWGGLVTTMLDATNQCLVDFMRDRPLSADDERGRALLAYIESLSGGPVHAQPLTVIAFLYDIESGDAAEGARVYEETCARCHGAVSTGTGRISSKQSIIPTETLSMWGADGARMATIEKVRHGKYFGIGTDMPLFSLEALSDKQLSHVLAYLEQHGLPVFTGGAH